MADPGVVCPEMPYLLLIDDGRMVREAYVLIVVAL